MRRINIGSYDRHVLHAYKYEHGCDSYSSALEELIMAYFHDRTCHVKIGVEHYKYQTRHYVSIKIDDNVYKRLNELKGQFNLSLYKVVHFLISEYAKIK